MPAGLVLGTGTYAVLSATLTDEQFLEWGWRVPFLASAVLIAVGMWIRLAVAESPIFQETLDAKSAAKMPVLDALKTYPKEIALAAGSFVATNATFYVGSVWLVSYATTALGYDRTTILNTNAALSLSDVPMLLAFGLLSDYIGRRTMFLTGMAVLALFAVPYFMLVSTGNIWLFMLGGLIVQACRCAVYGPQSAYFAEQFSTRMRYSGCSLAYQLAAILGGLAPLICTALVAITGSLYSVAAFVIVIAMVSFACSYLMTETLRLGTPRNAILSPSLSAGHGGLPIRAGNGDVRVGSLADIARRTSDVRFTPKSGHAERRHQCLLSAISRHAQRRSRSSVATLLSVRRAQRSPLAAQLTSGQYSQGPGTQRKTSPATATWQTDGNDR